MPLASFLSPRTVFWSFFLVRTTFFGFNIGRADATFCVFFDRAELPGFEGGDRTCFVLLKLLESWGMSACCGMLLLPFVCFESPAFSLVAALVYETLISPVVTLPELLLLLLTTGSAAPLPPLLLRVPWPA
jgi:hypothetical protein